MKVGEPFIINTQGLVKSNDEQDARFYEYLTACEMLVYAVGFTLITSSITHKPPAEGGDFPPLLSVP